MMNVKPVLFLNFDPKEFLFTAQSSMVGQLASAVTKALEPDFDLVPVEIQRVDGRSICELSGAASALVIVHWFPKGHAIEYDLRGRVIPQPGQLTILPVIILEFPAMDYSGIHVSGGGEIIRKKLPHETPSMAARAIKREFEFFMQKRSEAGAKN